MSRFFRIYLIVLLLGPLCARAEISLAPIFNDGAVLQCDMPVNVWGTADPGTEVTVSFAGQTKTAVADSSNHWEIVLDSMPASSEPRKLSVFSSNNPSIQCSNLLVGEVWLAAGQSNMQMSLKTVVGGPERLARTFPQIHFSLVPRKTGLPVQSPLTAEDLKWRVFRPGQNRDVSAVAFFFAEKIHNETGRPVGVIESAVGGTPCQAWMPLAAIESLPDVRYMADGVRSEQDKPFTIKTPSILFENMIRPLIPYTARGVIWYQGETGSSKPDEYRQLFPALIKNWREEWARPDWPFLFVQLAAYDSKNGDFAGQRAVQTRVRDTVPHTGMALAIDCGLKNDIHPKEKQPVGERLARLALDQVYGRDVVSRGPVFHSIEVREAGASRRQRPEGERQTLEKTESKLCVIFQCSEKKGGGGSASFQTLEKSDGKLRVIFQCLESELRSADGESEISGFEVAGVDGEFHAAAAEIVSADTVELACGAVSEPVSVRYAWRNWIEPPVTLENRARLPAEPFSVYLEKNGTWRRKL